MDRLARRGAALVFTTAAAVYMADRLTKLWAERELADAPKEVVRGVLTLRFTTNSGGAFSLGQSAPWLFATATLLVAGLIVVTAFRHRGALGAVATGLILGGALGNLTDRIVRGPGLRGRVVDFVDVHVWPVFNVADSAIVVGALLMVWASMRDGRRADREVPDGG